MEEIKKIINGLSLKNHEKENLINLLTTKKIYDIVSLQDKAYISLESGYMIILNNVTSDLKKNLEKIKNLSQESFIEKSFKTKRIRKTITWSDEEIEYLKSNHEKVSSEELSSILDKSIYQIEAKKMTLRLYTVKPWTDSDLEYLRENIKKTLYELSEDLNRSIASIKAKKRSIFRNG
ncbi:MAG: hypothetical protein ACRC51_08890 [Cetobacterium sp.]